MRGRQNMALGCAMAVIGATYAMAASRGLFPHGVTPQSSPAGIVLTDAPSPSIAKTSRCGGGGDLLSLQG